MVVNVSNVNASGPATSYIKAIDIWTWVCMTFLFGALLEFALVNCVLRSGKAQRLPTKKKSHLAVFPLDIKKKCEPADALPNLIYNESNKTMVKKRLLYLKSSIPF